MWDFFVSHAFEDKLAIARPLAGVLESCSFRVWFDETALSVGDSLRAGIEDGLSRSKFGVVILSPYFLSKRWTQDELSGFWARESTTTKVLLPVWHNICREDLVQRAPMLADRLAVSTERGLRFVAQQLINASFPGRSVPEGIVQHRDDRQGPTYDSRTGLGELLNAGATINDVRLYMSAHPLMLGANLTIPAFEVDAHDICDFVLLHVHGVSGGMEIEFVKFGSFDPSDGVVVEIQESERAFAEAARFDVNRKSVGNPNQRGKVVAGASERVSKIASLVRAFVERRLTDKRTFSNIDWKSPARWEVSLRIYAGRRNLEVAAARNALVASLRVDVASYDRLLDGAILF